MPIVGHGALFDVRVGIPRAGKPVVKTKYEKAARFCGAAFFLCQRRSGSGDCLKLVLALIENRVSVRCGPAPSAAHCDGDLMPIIGMLNVLLNETRC